MRYSRLYILFLLLLLPLSSYGRDMDFKTTGPVDIVADSVENDRVKNVFTATGNVELKEGARTLSADRVIYYENTQDAFAEGNVVLQDGGDRIECERMHLNLETKRGTLEKGNIFLKQGNFYIASGQIEKIGDAQYVMKKGEFTTCGWDRPAWKFAADDIDVTVEGYATTKGAKFYVLDYPVFYFPWGKFPAKGERQSGFLIPEITLSSRNGTMVNNAYYWAISKDKDATFYANYIRDRGVNLGAQFRYAMKEGFKGYWDYSIINDTKYEGTRWQINGKHEQTFFADLKLKADIHYTSDADYFRDFGISFLERAESQLKSTVYLEKALPKSLLTIEATYFQNLTGGPTDYYVNGVSLGTDTSYMRNFLGGNNGYTYQHLPQISYFTEYIPLLAGKLFTSVSADFTSFYREDQLVTCVVDAKGVSLYCRKTDPSADLLTSFTMSNVSDCVSIGNNRVVCRTKGDNYSRLALEPTIRLPFSVHGMNFLISGTYVGTGYLSNNSYVTDKTSSLRNGVRIEGDMNMQFLRTFSTGFLGIGDMQSLLKPQLKYTFTNYSYSGDTPSIDPYDSLYRTNSLTYSLNHYLYGTREGAQRELALMEISQTYGLSGNLDPSTLYNGYGSRLSDINARITLYPTSKLSFTNETILSTSGQGLTTMRNNLRYNETGKYRVSLWHNYNSDISNEVFLDLGGTYKMFDAGYQILYSFKEKDWLSTLYRIRYNAGCWALTLALTRTSLPTTDTRFLIKFDLAGISGTGK